MATKCFFFFSYNLPPECGMKGKYLPIMVVKICKVKTAADYFVTKQSKTMSQYFAVALKDQLTWLWNKLNDHK